MIWISSLSSPRRKPGSRRINNCRGIKTLDTGVRRCDMQKSMNNHINALKIISLLTIAIILSACETTPTKTIDMSRALNAEQVKALFTNKTFDGYNEQKGVEYQVYSQADGSMIHKTAKRVVTVTWEIKPDGQHCAIFPLKAVCGHIIPMGNGVYHKVSNGEHTQTLKHFFEGNQILF